MDHGKTELIKALTGADTDRLREEKTRGISIELGFAPFDLPDGRRAGVVDVPGHEKFVHHMLAGVPGFDLVLLVVAADEGVMPQTREHLDILHLLGVENGILVITKTDLIEDEDLLALVAAEIREQVRTTFLEDAPLYCVSARTGKNLDNLVAAMVEMTQHITGKTTSGPFILPIDRSFTLAGLGTVVTGTLVSGQMEAGTTGEVVPGGGKGKLRRLQVHGEDVSLAQAGQRVAVNLGGLSVTRACRGRVLATPGTIKETQVLDARLRLLERSPRPLAHRSRIRLHVGTAEALGRVSLLDCDQVEPGGEAWVQFRLEQPIAAKRGQRFVVRFYSPVQTMGGGWIVEPLAPRRRRHHLPTLQELELKGRGQPEELTLQSLLEHGIAGATPEKMAENLGLAPENMPALLESLKERGEAVRLGEDDNVYLARAVLEEGWQSLQALLREYHDKNLLRQGMPKELARTQLLPKLPPRAFQALLQHLADKNLVIIQREYVKLYHHQVALSEEQSDLLRRMEDAYKMAPFNPPGPRELPLPLADSEREELLQILIDQGLLVHVAENMVFHVQAVDKAELLLGQAASPDGSLTVSDYRRVLNTSRKYTLPLLEYFDARKITRRVGEKRVLTNYPAN